MGSCISAISRLKSVKRTSQLEGVPSHECQRQSSPHIASIHILDDDSLLNVFYLYRPAMFDGDEDLELRVTGGRAWDRERWWYRLAHVCRRWRNLILDMLAHSPPLPLAIDYDDQNCNIAAEDEEEIILALKQRDRVRRIRLQIPVSNLKKVVMAISEEYPVLEYLIMAPPIEDNHANLVLPETLQAPHLRFLILSNFTLPIGSRLLTAAVGLNTLGLLMNASTYFRPNVLLQWISSMPQLETLIFGFKHPFPSPDERQPPHMPITTLPNLRHVWFEGPSAYLEAVVGQIITPHLVKLEISFFNQLSFSVPCLWQFINSMNTTENLRLDSAKIEFFDGVVCVEVYPPEESKMYALALTVYCQCRHLDRQVSSVAQIFNPLGKMLSTVEHLTLKHALRSSLSEERDDEVDRTEWHELLRSFSKVKTLSVDDGLVGKVSSYLQMDNGELPLELLSELQEFTYSGNNDTFTSFVDTLQNADHPITLVHRSPSPNAPMSSIDVPAIT